MEDSSVQRRIFEISEGAYPKGSDLSVHAPGQPPSTTEVRTEINTRTPEQKTGISKQQMLSILKQTAKILLGAPALTAAALLGSAIFMVASGPAAAVGAIVGHNKMRDAKEWSKERQGAEMGVAIAAAPLQGAVRMFLWMANMSPSEGAGKEIISGMRHGGLRPNIQPQIEKET